MEPTGESLITDEARAMIGTQTPAITGYPVLEHEIQRYASAVDDPNPLWTDAEYAATTAHGGIIAPPLFVTIPFPNDRRLSALREDGMPKGQGDRMRIMPPLRVTRLVNGTTEAEFFQPIRPGDVLTFQARLAHLYEREGRSGRLAFIVTETTYTNQRGEVVAVVKMTNIAH